MDENHNNQNNVPRPQIPPPPMGFRPPGHGMAVASMVMGILSLVFWCLCIGYVIFAPLGIIFAIVARRQGSKSGMTIAGLVTSIVSIVSGIIYWVVVLVIGAAIFTAPWMDFLDMFDMYM